MLETDYKIKYTVYCVTNKVNGKKYIGKHQTKDLNDSYMGSGKLLRRAQKKYGLENFSREILFVFETEVEMNLKEKELVTEDFCLREDSYNLCVGGQGGFSYINRNGLCDFRSASKKGVEKRRILIETDEAYQQKVSVAISKGIRKKLENSDWREANRIRNIKKLFKARETAHSKTSNDKRSAAMKGRFIGEKNSNAKTIIDENGIVYNTMKSFMSEKRIDKSTMYKGIESGLYSIRKK